MGAGPTGLVLACELLARGIRARIIDKGDGVVLQTRALGIHARTLEVFDMMGLAERFVARGQVVRRFHMYADGKTLVRLELARNGSAFGFMLDVPQDVTETHSPPAGQRARRQRRAGDRAQRPPPGSRRRHRHGQRAGRHRAGHHG